MLPPTLLGILQELHSQYKSLKDGVVANYIPTKKQEAGDNCRDVPWKISTRMREMQFKLLSNLQFLQ